MSCPQLTPERFWPGRAANRRTSNQFLGRSIDCKIACRPPSRGKMNCLQLSVDLPVGIHARTHSRINRILCFLYFRFCKYIFPTVFSLGEVCLGGVECVDAKKRLRKLPSCDLPLKNMISKAILVRLAGRQANLQSIPWETN